MNNQSLQILVTNDDGIHAKGLAALVEMVKPFGKVVVVAPDKPQSGMGHAVTVHHPIRLTKVEFFDGIESYQSSGTPADCVKLAVDQIFHQKPDLCVSGINHGPNSSINVIYSGTLSAAMEAAIEGIPAIGFSLGDYSEDADFSICQKYVTQIVAETLKKKLPKDTLLNVNIPAIKPGEIKGMKICRQAKARWEEEFDKRQDPGGHPYYWLTGKFINHDKGEDTDLWALENNFVSVVPVQFDFTAHHAISILNENWNMNV